MQDGELLDDVVGARFDVGLVGAGEPAAAGGEVLEHHDVAVAVGVGEPGPGHPHRDLGCEVAVEAGLRDAHPGPVDELALLLVEGWELHEHGRRHAVAVQGDARAAGRSGARVDDGRSGDVAFEHVGEPACGELLDRGRERLRRCHVVIPVVVAVRPRRIGSCLRALLRFDRVRMGSPASSIVG